MAEVAVSSILKLPIQLLLATACSLTGGSQTTPLAGLAGSSTEFLEAKTPSQPAKVPRQVFSTALLGA